MSPLARTVCTVQKRPLFHYLNKLSTRFCRGSPSRSSSPFARSLCVNYRIAPILVARSDALFSSSFSLLPFLFFFYLILPPSSYSSSFISFLLLLRASQSFAFPYLHFDITQREIYTAFSKRRVNDEVAYARVCSRSGLLKTILIIFAKGGSPSLVGGPQRIRASSSCRFNRRVHAGDITRATVLTSFSMSANFYFATRPTGLDKVRTRLRNNMPQRSFRGGTLERDYVRNDEYLSLIRYYVWGVFRCFRTEIAGALARETDKRTG